MQLYFLCTGNSCRSQMAEGFAKKYAPNDWHIQSAGVEQHGLNPHAVAVMKDINIDISNHTSDLIDTDYLNSSDYVITLCGDAHDKCPMTPKHVQRIHWDLIDPAQANGSNADINRTFINSRNQIDDLVKTLIDTIRV